MLSWSAAEIEWFTENYPLRGKTYCAKMLDRPEASIRQKASRLGLRQDKNSEFFKDYQKRAAQSKVGKKRPIHSAIMKQKAKQGLLYLQRHKRYTHGLSHTVAYKRWAGMMRRCYKSTNKGYENYGGRGIEVCKEWHDLQTFCDWFNAQSQDEGNSLERKDVNGNYTPENCILINRYHQGRNRRTSVLNMDKARQIRKLYADGVWQAEIGRKVGVSSGLVWCVIHDEIWLED